MIRRNFLLLALLLVTSLATPAQIVGGPCPIIGDDGFAGPCCAPAANLNIPQFPAVLSSGVYGCLLDCDLERQFQQRVRISINQFLCDYAIMQIDVLAGSAGAPVMSGTFYAKYARTFTEFDPATGQATQVWRWLVNGDFIYTPTAVAGAPCPVPATGVNGRPVHFFGSVDYRCGGGSGTTLNPYSVRFDLSHLPRCISNAPWSARPLPPVSTAGNRSYHLVGPAPFSFSPAPPPEGFVPGESVRSSRVSWSNFNYTCLNEQRMQGQIQTAGFRCLCGPGAGVGVRRYADQTFAGRVTCGGTTVPFNSVPLPGITPTGTIALNLGSYANGTRLTVYWGIFQYTDLCTQEGPFHVVAGSGTSSAGGYRFFNTQNPTGGLLRSAVDLGNAQLLNPFPPAIGWGAPYVSTVVWNFSL